VFSNQFLQEVQTPFERQNMLHSHSWLGSGSLLRRFRRGSCHWT
jgi:hypothetical protein